MNARGVTVWRPYVGTERVKNKKESWEKNTAKCTTNYTNIYFLMR